MNFDKESKSRKKNLRGGGGGGGNKNINTRATIFYIQGTLSQPLLQTILSHENIPKGIQNKSHCSFNHQGKIIQTVQKWELSFLYVTHPHDLFYMTVKYHDYIPNGFQVMEQTRNCI